jgi:hypothetical protein
MFFSQVTGGEGIGYEIYWRKIIANAQLAMKPVTDCYGWINRDWGESCGKNGKKITIFAAVLSR